MATQAPQSARESLGPIEVPAMKNATKEEKRRDISLEIADVAMGQGFGPPLLPAWVAADVVLASGATTFALALAMPPEASRLFPFLISYVSLLLLALKTCGLHEQESKLSPIREGLEVCKAIAIASMIFLAVQISAQPATIQSRFVLVAASVNAIILVGSRTGFRILTRRRIAQGKAVRHALIVGGGRLGRSLATSIEHARDTRISVKGYIDDRGGQGENILGTLADCLTVARAEYIDEIYITLPIMRPGIMDLINRAREQHISVKVVPALLGGSGAAPVQFIGTHPAFTLHEEPVRGFAKFFKRLIDLVGASILLVFAAIPMLIIAVVVKLDSKGPVLYCSDRVGFKGRRFKFYKFRSMIQNADELKEKLRHLNEREGPFFKIKNDPRLTSSGRFLRATSLDELPQIFNVLKGEMSLVGPRPHPVDDYRQYRLEHRRRLDVLPGITGLWQVSARSDPSFERNMQLDLHYIERWSFWLDLKILAKTLPAVIRKEGV